MMAIGRDVRRCHHHCRRQSCRVSVVLCHQRLKASALFLSRSHSALPSPIRKVQLLAVHKPWCCIWVCVHVCVYVCGPHSTVVVVPSFTSFAWTWKVSSRVARTPAIVIGTYNNWWYKEGLLRWYLAFIILDVSRLGTLSLYVKTSFLIATVDFIRVFRVKRVSFFMG